MLLVRTQPAMLRRSRQAKKEEISPSIAGHGRITLETSRVSRPRNKNPVYEAIR